MAAPPTVRAIVADLDGTITDARRQLYPPTVRQLQRLRRRGVPVVIATGNVLPLALAVYRLLGLDGPLVAENGGLIYERPGGGDRVTRLADRRLALRGLRALERAGMHPTRLFTDRWRETEVALVAATSVPRARQILRGWPIEVVPTGYAVHLIERGRTKLPALRRVLRPLGLEPSDCLIAGDGENDIPMLEAAGWAVSFRGADPGARAAADYVARRSNAAGLNEAIKRARVAYPSGPR